MLKTGIPESVICNSPVSEYLLASLEFSPFSLALFSNHILAVVLTPAALLSKSFSVIKAVSAGFVSTIVWPNCSAKGYPNPVDPVFGAAIPPVATISLSHCNSIPISTKNFLSLYFTELTLLFVLIFTPRFSAVILKISRTVAACSPAG